MADGSDNQDTKGPISERLGHDGSDNQDIKRPIWERLGYDKKTDQKKDIRDPLLVVAALIAAVTFQAGVALPEGDWQEDKDNIDSFYAFVTFNTLALSTSILVLISLTFRFPFSFEVVVATLCMFATYASAIFAVVTTKGRSLSFRFLLSIFLAPFIIRALLEIFRCIRRKHPKSVGEIFKFISCKCAKASRTQDPV